MADIVCADILDWAAGYEGPQFHALLCDPPYELGFMGKDWDRSGIAFDPATWAALAEHLLPGAFGMAFASARGWHRLAVAIEDAGLRIHPSIFLWSFATGFPKSTKIERSFSNDSSPFCRCDDSQQQSRQHVPRDSARGEMDTSEDSRLNCSQDFRQDGELFRHVQDSGQGAGPSQDGALAHSHSGGPLIGIQQDNGPSHNLSEVQCSDRPATLDCQAQSADALLQSRVTKDETYRAHDSIYASTGDSEAKGPSSVCGDGDTKVSHSQHKRNSGNDLTFNPPVAESRSHSTTDGSHCQACGKARRGIWDGHRYGLQALKPAAEVLIVFQKPYQGRPVDSITQTGAGALWIDGGRVGIEVHDREIVDKRSGSDDGRREDIYQDGLGFRAKGERFKSHPSGRWPANLVLVHHPDCERVGTRRVRGTAPPGPKAGRGGYFGASDMEEGTYKQGFVDGSYADPNGLETIPDWRCHESCPVRRLGEQSGTLTSGKLSPENNVQPSTGWRGGSRADRVKSEFQASVGTAARFFHQSDWSLDIAERLANADPVRYQAKASRRERDAGLGERRRESGEEVYGDGLGNGPDRIYRRNPHPTCKPIALARYLATLLLPPPEYAPRRICVPFAGVMSEALGCVLAGWEHITAIEMEQEYCDIGEARLAHWASVPVQERML